MSALCTRAEQVLAKARKETCAAHVVLQRAGEGCRALYLVQTGQLLVTTRADAPPLLTLERGDCFGAEAARGVAAELTVKAGTECTLLALEAADVAELVVGFPQLQQLIEAHEARQGASGPMLHARLSSIEERDSSASWRLSMGRRSTNDEGAFCGSGGSAEPWVAARAESGVSDMTAAGSNIAAGVAEQRLAWVQSAVGETQARLGRLETSLTAKLSTLAESVTTINESFRVLAARFEELDGEASNSMRRAPVLTPQPQQRRATFAASAASGNCRDSRATRASTSG